MLTLADFLGLDIAPAVGGALVTVIGGTLLLALLRALGTTITQRRERERELFGAAYKAAMAWREMLYRVRRRLDGEESDQALIDRFHELQEQIDYHEGWIASESPSMKRSYCRLVKEVKDKTRDPIRHAWQEPERRDPADAVLDGDVHPDLDEVRERFLKDVRQHLSLWLLPKLCVWSRNRPSDGGGP